MPDTTRIPRERLAAYFDAVTKRLMKDDAPDGIDAEVVDLEIGHQEMVHGARLEGITYDAHSDTLEFALDVGDHRVLKPSEVWVTEAPNGIPTSIEVVHPDGAREIIAVKHSASHRLPPPSSSSA
jgi:hypothetical protein